MGFAARLSEGHLALAFTEPRLIGVRGLIDAVRTTDACLVPRFDCVLGQDRAAAAVAQHMRPFFQPVANADAVIEHKAIALPAALFLRDVFKVFEDPALEVEHVLDTLTDQVVG